MDHAEARELLDIAAAEPGGLDRLMAGDTADAAALAGHLAGCPDCAGEMARLRRDAGVIRDIVRAIPPPELRDRTLARIAAVGRVRGPATESSAAPEPVVALERPSPATRRARLPAWLAAAAAVLALLVAGTALLIGGQASARTGQLEAELAQRSNAVGALARVTAASLRVTAQADVEHVDLAGSGGSGTLVFSPATRELVVVATGLAAPPAGREFRCWIEVDGQRVPVGRMFFAGDLSFWVGPVDDVADLPAGARFGVTLVEAGGSSLDGDPVLSGVL